MNKTKIGVVIALEAELDIQHLLQMGIEAVGVIGVGKVNAAIGAMNFLQKHPNLDLIINMGTAGSVHKTVGEVLRCAHFVQRDFDLPFEGFEHFNTEQNFIAELEAMFGSNVRFDHTCSTGDNFVHLDHHHEAIAIKADCIEMEAYAVAKVCKHFGKPFLAMKYVSDNTNSDSKEDWTESLQGRASKALIKDLEALLAGLA